MLSMQNTQNRLYVNFVSPADTIQSLPKYESIFQAPFDCKPHITILSYIYVDVFPLNTLLTL